MARSPLPRMLGIGLVAFVATSSLGAASAQDAVPRHHRAARVHPVAAASTPYRGLTINRPPADDAYSRDEQDIYRDGPIRYNDIRDFSPAPYVTSGVQHPFGLDGIGGFGSDLGFSAGADAALYDRGAGTNR